MGFVLGCLLAMYVMFLVTIGIGRVCSWAFEIGAFIGFFLFLWLLFSAGFLLTWVFLIGFIFMFGFLSIAIAAFKGGNDGDDKK